MHTHTHIFLCYLCFQENAKGNYLNVNRGNTHTHSIAHDWYTNQHKHIHTETHPLSFCLSPSTPHTQLASAAHQRRTIKGKTTIWAKFRWGWGCSGSASWMTELCSAKNSNAAFCPGQTAQWVGWTPPCLYFVFFSPAVHMPLTQCKMNIGKQDRLEWAAS